MSRKRLPSYGNSTFPTPSARARNGRIGVTPLLRCVQCGFVNDVRSTTWGTQGDGLVPQEGGQPGEQRVAAGCAQCGSIFWRKNKPPALPDDEFLSDGHVKKRR